MLTKKHFSGLLAALALGFVLAPWAGAGAVDGPYNGSRTLMGSGRTNIYYTYAGGSQATFYVNSKGGPLQVSVYTSSGVNVASGVTGSDGTLQVAWKPSARAQYRVGIVNVGSANTSFSYSTN